MNPAGPRLEAALDHLGLAFGEIDKAAGLLKRVKHSAALDARGDLEHAIRQVRALAVFCGLSPDPVESERQ